jgi:hypothetical protein
MSPKKEKKDSAYQREQGNRSKHEQKGRNISFSLSKHITTLHKDRQLNNGISSVYLKSYSFE